MDLWQAQLVAQKVRILYSALKWSRDSLCAAWGPGWLKRQVRQAAARGEPIRIIIGAGGVPAEPGWIPTNVQFLNMLVDEHWQQAFGEHRIDAIFAEHVWEHLTPADGKAAAAQCYKYIKPGGYLRIAVPDGLHPDPDYIEFVRPGGPGPGASDHKLLYTYQTLSEMLQSVGFQVDVLEYYDESGDVSPCGMGPRTRSRDAVPRMDRKEDRRRRDAVHVTDCGRS